MAVKMRLSSGYQVTVPAALRKALDLQPGDELEGEIEGGVLTMRKAATKRERIEAMMAEFDRLNAEHRKNMTPEQKKFAEMSKGWTVNQYHEYYDNLPETKAYIKEKYGV